MSAQAKKKAEKRAAANKSEAQKDQDFLSGYNRLCEKHKRELAAVPQWRLSTETRDYRMVISYTINRTDTG